MTQSKNQEELEKIILEWLKKKRTLDEIINDFYINGSKELANAILLAGYIKKDEIEVDEKEIETILTYFGIAGRPKIAHAISQSVKEIIKEKK